MSGKQSILQHLILAAFSESGPCRLEVQARVYTWDKDPQSNEWSLLALPQPS